MIRRLVHPTMRAQVKRYAQFCAVGSTGVLVDMGVLYVLADPGCFDLNLTFSKAIAAEAAILNNFLWNDLWTFRELSSGRTGCHARLKRFFRFNFICTAGLGLSVVLLNVQVSGFRWNLYLANCVAIVLVSVWNYVLNLRFGWGDGGLRTVGSRGPGEND